MATWDFFEADSLRAANRTVAKRHRVEKVERLVQGEILPRLMIAAAASDKGDPPTGIHADDLERFTEAVLYEGAAEADAIVRRLLENGTPQRVIILDVLAATARNLGLKWEEDSVGFLDVGVAMTRIHHVLRTLCDADGHIRVVSSGRSALLGVLREDTHIFGLALTAKSFREAGWRVSYLPGAAYKELAKAVAESHFDIIGLTASYDQSLNSVSKEIEGLRRSSANSGILVLVGGGVFNDEGISASCVGADIACTDAFAAPSVAEEVLGERLRLS